MNELESFRDSIANLDSYFDDADSVHEFGVYLDDFASDLVAFLKANGIQHYSYSVSDLLRALDIDNDIVHAADSLTEFIEDRSYGESCLSDDNVSDAENYRKQIYNCLVEWCEEKMMQ